MKFPPHLCHLKLVRELKRNIGILNSPKIWPCCIIMTENLILPTLLICWWRRNKTKQKTRVKFQEHYSKICHLSINYLVQSQYVHLPYRTAITSCLSLELFHPLNWNSARYGGVLLNLSTGTGGQEQ